jgi:hypothetical protein
LNCANGNLSFIAKTDIKVAGKSIRDFPLDIPLDGGFAVNERYVILPGEI